MVRYRIIEGYEGFYQVTEDGRVWSVPRTSVQGKRVGGYFLKYSNTKERPYNRVELRKDGRDRLFFVHTLVARAFPEICGEWFEGCEVHHKNYDTYDNRAENLIVLTKEEHMALHGDSDATYDNRSAAHKKAWETRERRYGWKKPVKQYSMDGEFIREFESAKSAANETGTNYPSLSSCLNGRYKTAGGYIWRFAV